MDDAFSLFDQPIEAPYPGLRPFQSHESSIFFGRDEHVADMLTVLENRRFLAVVGPSGGGKSSLVLAGLIPALRRGELLTQRSNDWRFIVFRPGDSPYSNFAESTQRHLVPKSSGKRFHDGDVTLTEVVLRGSPFGFLDVLRDANVDDTANVLVLVDQFEELFRFRSQDAIVGEAAAKRRDDSAMFVQLLLETAKQTRRPVNVMLTMRTDFLGDCDIFDGLPQAINQSQYLTPRLNPSQLTQAITQPIQKPPFHGEVAAELVHQILNEIGTGRDELPVVQHALFRTWQKASERHPNGDVRLSLQEYNDVGALKLALSNHADAILDECKERGLAHVVEKVFRGLCERASSGQLIRRPATIQRLKDEAGVDVTLAQVKDVVEAYRRSDCCFLTPPADRKLSEDSRVDLSHEAIIRQWQVLKNDWICREEDSKRRLLRVIDDFEKYSELRGNPISGVELDDVEKWWREQAPTAAWIDRYSGKKLGFAQRRSAPLGDHDDTRAAVNEFIAFCRSEQNRREKEIVDSAAQARETETKRRLAEAKAQSARRWVTITGGIAFVAILFAISAVLSFLEASAARDTAKSNANDAEENAKEAREQESFAKKAGEEAKQNAVLANQNAREAKQNALEAKRESSRAFWQIAAAARDSGNSVKATHALLQVESALEAAGASKEELENLSLAEQFTSANIVQTISGFGSNAVSNKSRSRLVSWGEDHLPKLWKLDGDQQISSVEAPMASIEQMHQDSSSQASKSTSLDRSQRGGESQRVDASQQVDVSQREDLSQRLRIRGDRTILGVAYSSDDSKFVVWRADGSLFVQNANDATVIWKGEVDARIVGAGFDSQAETVFCWNSAGTIRSWRLSDGEAFPTMKLDPVDGIEGALLSADKAKLLTWSYSGRFDLWDLKNGRPIPIIKNVADAVEHVGSQKALTRPRDLPYFVGAWSKNGALVVTASRNAPVRVWDVNTGECTSLRHDGRIRGVAFRNEDQEILTWGDNGKVMLWTLLPRPPGGNQDSADTVIEPTFVIDNFSEVIGLQLNADESKFICWGGDSACLWDLTIQKRDLQSPQNTAIQEQRLPTEERFAPIPQRANPKRKLIQSWRHTSSVLNAQFNSDESLVLTLCSDNTAFVWSVTAPRAMQSFGNESPLRGGQFTLRESQVLTWYADGTLKRWNSKHPRLSDEFNRDPDEQSEPTLEEGSSSPIQAPRPATQAPRPVIAAPSPPPGKQPSDSNVTSKLAIELESRIADVVFSETSHRLLMRRIDSNQISSLSAYEFLNDRHRRLPSAGQPFRNGRDCQGVLISRDGSKCLTWSHNTLASMLGDTVLWDLQNSTAVQRFNHSRENSAVRSVTWSDDETRILTLGLDNTAYLWQTDKTVPVQQFKHLSEKTSQAEVKLDGAVLSVDGKRILTWGSDLTARLWDAASGNEVQRFVHGAPIRSAEFATGQGNNITVLTWTGREAEPAATFSVPAFTLPSILGLQSNRSVGSLAGEAHLWQLGHDSPIATLRHDTAVNGATLSFDATKILTCSNDGTAVLWDLPAKSRLRVLRHAGPVLGARFLRNGFCIVTWSKDGTAGLWDVNRTLPLAVLKHEAAVVGVQINREETRMLTWSDDGSAKWWDISDHDKGRSAKDRRVEFEVRSETRLDDDGEIVPLNQKELEEKRALLQKQAAN